MTQNILNSLNEEQYSAVIYNSGSMLILAGAGSGKTKVLTTRIAWLVNELNIIPEEILAVTFTNKAAKEMQERIGYLLGSDTKLFWVGTFHSIALKLLTRHYQLAGLNSNFQIIDNRDQTNILRRIINGLGLDDNTYNIRDVQKFISTNKEECIRAKNCNILDVKKHALWVKIYREYEFICNRDSLLDFSELLLRCYELLRDNRDVLDIYHNKFKHILVDEFQDTNMLQYKLIKLLHSEHCSIFAVGDDDQSIYSFRGAKSSNMQLFLKEFHIKAPIRLQQNYRSTTNILEIANSVIKNNNNRIGKELWTNNLGGEKAFYYQANTEEDEALFIVNEIKNLVSNGVLLNEIAILYRSNAQSRVIEQVLYNNGIAYKVYGGLRFFDRQEIKIVLSYLRLILNNNDNDAFLKVVNYPPRGIGAKTLDKLQEIALQQDISLFDACNYLDGKSLVLLQQFKQIILKISEKKDAPIHEIIDYVINNTDMVNYYEKDKQHGQDRIDNLNELINATIELTNDYKLSLAEFIYQAVLEPIDVGGENKDSSIKLMTVHASKGLEFKVIFIVGLEDGLFPHDSSKNSQEELEEERRLMYVAITRAKQQLYLLRACNRLLWGRRQFTLVSKFVNEIPSHLIHQVGVNKNKDTGYLIPAKIHVDNSGINVFNALSKSSENGGDEGNEKNELKGGDFVVHQKFGKGKILEIIKNTNRVKAEIFFIGIGKKVLDLSVAKIEKI